MSPYVTRCAAPFCRTTVTDWDRVDCPHGASFCGGCVWEEGCDDCRGEAA